MNSIVKLSALGACLAVAIAGVQTTSAAGKADNEKDYAEGVYRDFSAASGDAVSFEVRTMAAGPMSRLQGRSFVQLTGEPSYRLGFGETRESRIAGPAFGAAPAQTDRTELDGDIGGFDIVGLPSRLGAYRILAVTARTGGQTREHRALEFCWKSLDHCVVYDPQIEFLDSVVNNYRTAKAEGYGPRIQEQLPEPVPAGQVGIQAVCRLASNTGIIGRSLTWSSRSLTYKNLYGITVVQKTLGGQQVGITCSSTCKPSMYGYSNQSSASANLGFSADCGNRHATGITGGKGTAHSQTRCTHKTFGGAKADVSVNGSGASINLSWDLSGSVDSSGGSLTDTCAYF